MRADWESNHTWAQGRWIAGGTMVCLTALPAPCQVAPTLTDFGAQAVQAHVRDPLWSYAPDWFSRHSPVLKGLVHYAGDAELSADVLVQAQRVAQVLLSVSMRPDEVVTTADGTIVFRFAAGSAVGGLECYGTDGIAASAEVELSGLDEIWELDGSKESIETAAKRIQSLIST